MECEAGGGGMWDVVPKSANGNRGVDDGDAQEYTGVGTSSNSLLVFQS